MSDKKKAQLVNDINNNEDDERDDEEQVENEAQQRRPLAPSNALNENRLPENNARAAGRVPPRLSNEDNYRVAKRERFQPRRTHLRSGQQSEHGEEVVDENNERRAGQIRKRNAVWSKLSLSIIYSHTNLPNRSIFFSIRILFLSMAIPIPLISSTAILVAALVMISLSCCSSSAGFFLFVNRNLCACVFAYMCDFFLFLLFIYLQQHRFDRKQLLFSLFMPQK